jgi:hypothetical protein
VEGNAAGTMIGVGDRLVFGRQSEGAGQLAIDPELSRLHAEISRRPTGDDLGRAEAEIAPEQGESVRLRLRDGSWRIVGGELS